MGKQSNRITRSLSSLHCQPLGLPVSEPEGRHITSQQSREERSGGEWAERLWMLSSCTSPLQGTQKGFIVESQLFMLLSCITLCFTGSELHDKCMSVFRGIVMQNFPRYQAKVILSRCHKAMTLQKYGTPLLYQKQKFKKTELLASQEACSKEKPEPEQLTVYYVMTNSVTRIAQATPTSSASCASPCLPTMGNAATAKKGNEQESVWCELAHREVGAAFSSVLPSVSRQAAERRRENHLW
ncbi:hypothetical protein D9C73_008786 [Collichthys lucidus]|uniref:Uncharacterized protein n=1 Tax=Collichthys lucidus TaxID=240159 RepID=A0A4U5UIZ6_COLLU|nr:hypothetical protein D9C73_008786 [Collichthys lucidus]